MSGLINKAKEVLHSHKDNNDTGSDNYNSNDSYADSNRNQFSGGNDSTSFGGATGGFDNSNKDRYGSGTGDNNFGSSASSGTGTGTGSGFDSAGRRDDFGATGTGMDSSAPLRDNDDNSNRRDDTFGSTDPGNFGSSAERRGDTFGSSAGAGTAGQSSYSQGRTDDINAGFPSGGDGAGGYSSNNPGTDFQASGGGSAYGDGQNDFSGSGNQGGLGGNTSGYSGDSGVLGRGDQQGQFGGASGGYGSGNQQNY